MAERQKLVAGEFYHVYNRGVEKRDVFLDPNDHERFIKLLYACNDTQQVRLARQGLTLPQLITEGRTKPIVDICAYCLMPNHFHLLLYETTESGISNFMQKLSTGYTMFFNKKYNRVGSLFQGTFKSKHVQKDEQLRHLVTYIHLNPIALVDRESWEQRSVRKDTEKKIRLFIDGYKYSSFHDYQPNVSRQETLILNKQKLLEATVPHVTFDALVDALPGRG